MVRDTITHEVGHTLGLTHNFRASTVYTRAQLQDKDFTAKNGISGSVMDYNACQHRRHAAKAGQLQQHHHRPVRLLGDRVRLQADRVGRRRSCRTGAHRRAQREIRCWPSPTTPTPAVSRRRGHRPAGQPRDLGQTTRWPTSRSASRSRASSGSACRSAPQAGRGPMRQRRVLLSTSAHCATSPALVGKYVGGMYTARDVTGRRRQAASRPVEAKRQKRARFLATGCSRSTASASSRPSSPASRPTTASGARRPGQHPGGRAAAARTWRSTGCSAPAPRRACSTCRCTCRGGAKGLISLNEVTGTRAGRWWSELKQAGEIDRLRRNLQREHLRRVQGLLVRVSGRCRPMR